jgi:hypothetical protein
MSPDALVKTDQIFHQVSTEGRLRDITVAEDSPMLRVTKGGRTLAEISDVRDWVTLQPETPDTQSRYRPIVWGYRTNFDKTGFRKVSVS